MEYDGLFRQIAGLQQEVAGLKREAIKYDLLKRTAGFAILTLRGYVFVDCNDMAEKLFRLHRQDIVGKEPFMLSPKYQPDGQLSSEAAISIIDNTMKEESKRFDWLHIRGDGSRFFADVTLNKVVVDKEELIQVILIDISKEKTGKERLENQNRIIRQLNKQYQQQNKKYKEIVNQLKQQQNITETILKNMNDGVAVFNQQTVFYVNEQIYYLTGCSEENLSVQSLFDSIGLELHHFELPYAGQKVEFWPKGKNGDKYLRMLLISMEEDDMYMLHLSDYTEIKKAHTSIEESEYKFRSIFHSSTDSIVLLSYDLKIREVNDTFISNYKFQRDQLANIQFKSLFIEEHCEYVSNMFTTKSFRQFEFLELKILNYESREFEVEVGVNPISIGKQKMFLVIIRDISFRKKFEQEMFAKIIETEEKERKRVAADLHDELGPVLSSLKLYNTSLKKSDEPQYLYLSKQFEELLNEAVDTVRRLSEDLSPVTLYKGGLEKALKKRILPLQRFYTCKLELKLEDARFKEQIEINLYRIINELLNNTIKHAKADSIQLELSYDLKSIRCVYSDNGIGFQLNPDSGSQAGHGTGNILGRLKSINATYKILTDNEEGVCYEISIPHGKEN